jgi:hypothetical protein
VGTRKTATGPLALGHVGHRQGEKNGQAGPAQDYEEKIRPKANLEHK